MPRNPRILVYHIGSLGDTLVAVPALWAVRERYPGARVTLLSGHKGGPGFVSPEQVLKNSPLVDEFIQYPDRGGGAIGALIFFARMAFLALDLRLKSFDSLVYLIRASSGASRVRRDLFYFRRLVGVGRVDGDKGFRAEPPKRGSSPLAEVPHVADQLLGRLRASGIPTPADRKGRMDVALTSAETGAAARWIAGLPEDGGRPWIGFGIGGKIPVNRWPLADYERLGRALIEKCDVWPVIFGGSAEGPLADELLGSWGRGYSAVDALPVRETLAVLGRCRVFVGNDTGTMHMASAAGVRCVGIYSARNPPGLWDPYGPGGGIVRKAVHCEGCGLEVCLEYGAKCLADVTVAEVFSAVASRLAPEA